MSDWSATTLGDLANRGHLELGDGYRTKKSEHGKPGLPILRVAEVLDGRIEPRFEDFVGDSYRRAMGPKISRPGDIVLTTKGTVGRVTVMPSDSPEFVYSPQVCFFRTTPGGPLVSRYLYYWFKSEFFWSQAFSVKSQTDMADYINLGDIRSLAITIPPRRVQLAVTSVLEVLDDKIIVNQQIGDTAHELMKFKYMDASSLGVTIATIGQIAKVFDGPHATPRKTASGPWFLSISSLRGGRLDLEESAHVTEDDYQRWTRRVTPCSGDVLFSYETRLGEAALMPSSIRACLGRRIALLRPVDNAVGSRTLLQAFLSQSFQDTIRKHTIYGATVDRIPLNDLPSWPIELPAHKTHPLEEVLGSLDDLTSNKERENERLITIRDALLQRLMSGEIRVRDAEKIVEDVT